MFKSLPGWVDFLIFYFLILLFLLLEVFLTRFLMVLYGPWGAVVNVFALLGAGFFLSLRREKKGGRSYGE